MNNDEDEKFRKIANDIEDLHRAKPHQYPWTEQELYDRAFAERGEDFPLGLQGEPIACESIFEEGQKRAAMALLGLALTENLSSANLGIIQAFYDAINPDVQRGEFVLRLGARRPGAKPKSFKAQLREKMDDAITATLVELAERKFGKKEAAVAYVADLKRVSRASIFRQMARNEKYRNELSQENDE